MSERIPAIETKYKGILFRSRLEARWACFFDKVGLPWAYEPTDLNGYIPDFILPLEEKVQLIEIKPDTRIDDLGQYHGKIAESGWEGEAGVCGSMLHHSRDWNGHPTIGTHYAIHNKTPYEYGVLVLGHCQACGRTTLVDGHMGWDCRRCGENHGGRHLMPLVGYELAWAEAMNETRWNP